MELEIKIKKKLPIALKIIPYCFFEKNFGFMINVFWSRELF